MTASSSMLQTYKRCAAKSLGAGSGPPPSLQSGTRVCKACTSIDKSPVAFPPVALDVASYWSGRRKTTFQQGFSGLPRLAKAWRWLKLNCQAHVQHHLSVVERHVCHRRHLNTIQTARAIGIRIDRHSVHIGIACSIPPAPLHDMLSLATCLPGLSPWHYGLLINETKSSKWARVPMYPAHWQTSQLLCRVDGVVACGLSERTKT